MAIDRAGLAEFLRRRRESLQPEDVGLPARAAPPDRRAAPRGGRRALPHVDRLLRAAGAGARPAAVGADARLDRPGAAPVARRARPPVPAGRAPAAAARRRPASTSAPACCGSSTGSATPPRRSSPSSARRCARPRSAVALTGDTTRYTGPARSRGYRWFTDPAARELHVPEDHDFLSRMYAAGLRAHRHAAGTRVPGGAAGRPAAAAERGVPHPVGSARGRRPSRRGQALPAPRGRPAGAELPDAGRPGPVAPPAGLHRRPRHREPREAAAARGHRRPVPLLLGVGRRPRGCRGPLTPGCGDPQERHPVPAPR